MGHAQSASLLAGQANAERTTKGIDHVGKNVSAPMSNATIHAQQDSLAVGQVNAWNTLNTIEKEYCTCGDKCIQRSKQCNGICPEGFFSCGAR